MRIDIKRTGFYEELSAGEQKKYLESTRDKFLPTIDNIYYSIFLADDKKDNPRLLQFLQQLEGLKRLCMESHQPQEYGFGLQVDNKAYKMYKYCLSMPDLYDLFILNYLPNEDTPRVLVQIRAFGLWHSGVDKMLSESFNAVENVFASLGCKLEKCRESRIDYCYHTNIIANPEKIFGDRNISKQLKTSLRRWHQTGRIDGGEEGTIFRKDYLALGERSSNNVFVRCYNKTLEVIEQGYKGFFFELWYENGLVSFYDKFCFDYALQHGDYDYVHKAKLLFYLKCGTREDRKKEYAAEIQNAKNTVTDFERIAKQFMPEVTTVMNIEFETKRRFYYFSDEFIDTILRYKPRENMPRQLYRIYRITDNRALFLDHLTSKVLAFERKRERVHRRDGDSYVWETNIIYASWWERLRNTKLDSLKADEQLMRKYSSELDERIIKRKFIDNVASVAVYANNVFTDFVEDISDMLSNFNDNDAHKLSVAVDGEFETELLLDYRTKKAIKEKRLKNRKNKKAL